ncbi:hypothetical protein FRC01_003995 [Tulasnella sp. 417]|nr:hypothetical protein FRC01_003995 [Tulasnella sp. 417]
MYKLRCRRLFFVIGSCDPSNGMPASSTIPATAALAPVTVDPRKAPTPPDQSGSAVLYQAPPPDTSGLLALLAQAQATATPAETNHSSNAPPTPNVGIDSTQLAFLQQLAGNLAQPSGANDVRKKSMDRLTNILHTQTGLLNLRTLATTVQIIQGVASTIAHLHLATEIIAATNTMIVIGGGVTVIEVGSTIVKASEIDVEEDRTIEIMSEVPRAEDGGTTVGVTLPGEGVDHLHKETDTANQHISPRGPRYLNVLAKARRFKAQTRRVKVRNTLSPTINTSAIPSFESQPSKSLDTSHEGPGSQSADEQGTLGLQGYDFTKFDPTNPASWDSLGKAWEVSYGKLPTQEELMMFVMTGGMSTAGGVATTGVDAREPETNQIPTWDGGSSASGQAWNGQQQNFQNQRGRGRGRGRGYSQNRGGYGGARDGRNGFGDDGYSGSSYPGSSDAVVLGGGDSSSSLSPAAYGGSHSVAGAANTTPGPNVPSNGAPSASSPVSGTVATKGQMVKVGDKWKWVKAGDIIP